MEKLVQLDQDSILMAVSPIIYTGKKLMDKMAAKKRRQYGASTESLEDSWSIDVPTLCFLLIGLAIAVGLWIVPMVQAFRCPGNANVSIMWGLLILFFGPLVGVIFLLVGCPAVPGADAFGETGAVDFGTVAPIR